MKELTMKLPYPPSVNHYWCMRAKKVRNSSICFVYISDKGMKFRKAVANIAMLNRSKFFGDALLRMEVKVYPPDLRRRDLDNLAKGLLDSLQHAGVYTDDNQIKQLYMEMLEKRAGGEVELTLRVIE